MNSQVIWMPSAQKDLKRLGRAMQERVRRDVRRFAETGYGNIRRVEGREPELALRVGKWRVFLIQDKAKGVVSVLRVRPRGSAYQE